MPQEGQVGTDGAGDQSREGKGEGGLLSAPVPGMDPGTPVPGAAPPTNAAGTASSGQGGDEAGTGTAEMFDAASDPLKATAEARAQIVSGEEGESAFRAVEGGARAERAGRSSREVVSEFLAVEEQSLDEESLPRSRRQQVMRYFSGVREKFESTEPAPSNP